jgi:2-oxoglutarate/2-oxoacid ferredoxin oxidoreductase subunit alpha
LDYSIKIGGEAGQGIQTIGDTLAKVFSRSGYHVFTHQDYESRIRGGHNFFQIRVSDHPIMASRAKIDVIVALDAESIPLHGKELSPNGVIIYDQSVTGAAPQSQHGVESYLDIPLLELATRHGTKIMVNTVATGAVMGIFRLDLQLFEKILETIFQKKGRDVIDANINAALSGYNYVIEHCKTCSFSLEPEISGAKRTVMLISGIEAIGLGALSAGCKFYAAYPMTPSTGIMNYLAGKEKEFGIVVEQAEDEIAAINMALGASFAGVRSMTGTAGGGFALMVEGLSLAGMTETPVVIALGQRPAPATGLPTRTEQGDLLFAIYAAHGEFPRVVFAPGTPEQAFFLTNKAFDLAEKYQVPVFLVFDQYLADTLWTCNPFDMNTIVWNDYRLRGEEFRNRSVYKRHAFTDTGISPLGIPGDAEHVVVTDSDEHDEEGHIIEDGETRNKMVQKRLMKKSPLLRCEIKEPLYYGGSSPRIVIAGWGSTYGVMKEAVDVLSEQHSIGLLHFSELYPFPSPSPLGQNYLSVVKNAQMTICIENNAKGQFSRLMKAETGFSFHEKINKYDGRPFLAEELTGEISARIGRL